MADVDYRLKITEAMDNALLILGQMKQGVPMDDKFKKIIQQSELELTKAKEYVEVLPQVGKEVREMKLQLNELAAEIHKLKEKSVK